MYEKIIKMLSNSMNTLYNFIKRHLIVVGTFIVAILSIYFYLLMGVNLFWIRNLL